MPALPAPLVILAHGGAAGAGLETGLVVAVLAVFFAVWIRERRARKAHVDPDDPGSLAGDEENGDAKA